MFGKSKDTAKQEKPIKEKPVKEKKEKPVKEKKEKPVKEKPVKQPKQKKDKHGSKVEQELSKLAKDLGIRVSSPYGYYPEDVDPIILDLQKSVSDLTKENQKLAKEAHEATNNLKIVNSELSQLRMQMSLMEVPDVSAEEGFAMMSRIDSITGNYNSESVVDLKMSQNRPKQKVKLNLKK